MTTAPDPLQPPSASSMPPDVAGDLYVDDEDAAGYQAMMSELPTIVSMSGLLDGDFDELNGKIPLTEGHRSWPVSMMIICCGC
jgi:hypothetical protein